jgi:hypothetical protein
MLSYIIVVDFFLLHIPTQKEMVVNGNWLNLKYDYESI